MNDGDKLRKKILVVKDLKNFLEREINENLFKENMTDQELFLLSSYVSKTVSQFVRHFSTLWRAAEELWLSSQETGYNPYELEVGGKKCFIICVFFPEIRKRRRVGERYYSEMGISLFFSHYLRTDQEISYHMSNSFDQMVELTQKTICAST